jgi:hypothetical protein
MGTAKRLKAEWRHVLPVSLSTGAKEDNQVLGAFGLLDFTMLQPVLAWRAF